MNFIKDDELNFINNLVMEQTPKEKDELINTKRIILICAIEGEVQRVRINK